MLTQRQSGIILPHSLTLSLSRSRGVLTVSSIEWYTVGGSPLHSHNVYLHTDHRKRTLQRSPPLSSRHHRVGLRVAPSMIESGTRFVCCLILHIKWIAHTERHRSSSRVALALWTRSCCRERHYTFRPMWVCHICGLGVLHLTRAPVPY